MSIQSKLAIALITVGMFMLLASAVYAQDDDTRALVEISSDTGRFYYEIGGARTFAYAPSLKRTQRLTLSPFASFGYSCGEFELKDNLERSINDLKNGIDEIGDTMEYAVGEAISSLPMYILYRADPQMAETIQNAIARIKKAYEIAIKSCEEMERETAAGGNPYASWVEFGKAESYKQSANTGATATEAKEVARNEGSCQLGVPWVGGMSKGGQTQDRIAVVSDVVIAGYNLLAGRDALDKSLLQENVQTDYLRSVWPAPDDAAEWAVQVVGERRISVCKDSPKDSTPGSGLHIFAEEELIKAQDALNEAVDESEYVDYETMIDSPVALSPYLIAQIKAQPRENRELIKARLASEVALNTVIDRALLVKRIITTGRREPNIEAAVPAREEINGVVDMLETAINDMLFESEVRDRMVRNTARTIIHDQRASEERGLSSPGGGQRDPNTYKGGAVKSQ